MGIGALTGIVALTLQPTLYKYSSYKCYFPLSVTKKILPKILQKKSVIFYLLSVTTLYFLLC
jgi:hypothetical protein